MALPRWLSPAALLKLALRRNRRLNRLNANRSIRKTKPSRPAEKDRVAPSLEKTSIISQRSPQIAKPSLPNPVETARIEWFANHCGDGTIAGAYRHIAMGMEEALEKNSGGVSLEKPLAMIVTKALWDFADRVELDS